MHFMELVKRKKWVCVGEGPLGSEDWKTETDFRARETKDEAKAKVEEAIRELENLEVLMFSPPF